MILQFRPALFYVLLIATETMTQSHHHHNPNHIGPQVVYYPPNHEGSKVGGIPTEPPVRIPDCIKVENMLSTLLSWTSKDVVPTRHQFFNDLHSICSEWKDVVPCRQYSGRQPWHRFLLSQCYENGMTLSPVEKCLENNYPPGIGRFINYCYDGSKAESDWFAGMGAITCVEVYVKGLLYGPNRGYQSPPEEFQFEEKGFEREVRENCTRDPFGFLSQTALSKGDETQGVSWGLIIVAVLMVGLAIPVFYSAVAPPAQPERKNEILWENPNFNQN